MVLYNTRTVYAVLQDVWISTSYAKWIPQSDLTVTLLSEDIEESFDAVPKPNAMMANREHMEDEGMYKAFSDLGSVYTEWIHRSI